MQKPIQKTATARLNIADLPSLTDCMSKGGMYALIAETPPTRFPVLASCLFAALQDQIPCTVILPEQAETFIERLESFGQLNTEDALNTRELQVLLCQNDFAKKLFKFGIDAFTKEMARFDIRPSGLLIFDKADELFSLHDISLALAQADVLSQWFTELNITALFCFNSLADDEASNLQALMDKLSGLVHIVGERDGLALAFDYWQSPEGTIASKHYPLSSQNSGLYKVNIHTHTQVSAVTSNEKTSDLKGVSQFYHMDAQLDSMYQQLPGEWHYVDSLVGMIYATRGSQSATVVLSFESGTKLRELAETVHTLRLGLGKRACIVIHEKKSSLRYQNEALLLRLGVNLVIHRDVPISRLPLLLESVKGQVFERRMDINFETALASVLPSTLRGYQAPVHFCPEVHKILDRSETIDIPCTLFVGIPVAGTDIASLLSNIVLSRAGDLSSSDGENCYLFLNGCPESAILITVERLLGVDIDQVFQSHRFITRKPEIHAELDALTRTAELRDLSSLAPLVINATAATHESPDISEIVKPQEPPHIAMPIEVASTASDTTATSDIGTTSGLFKITSDIQIGTTSGLFQKTSDIQIGTTSGLFKKGGDTQIGTSSGLFRRGGGAQFGTNSGLFNKAGDVQIGSSSGLFKKADDTQISTAKPKIPTEQLTTESSTQVEVAVPTTSHSSPTKAREVTQGASHIVFGKDPVPRAQRSIQRPATSKSK